MYLGIVSGRKQLAIDKSTIKHSVPPLISSRCVSRRALLELGNLQNIPTDVYFLHLSNLKMPDISKLT